MEDAGKDERRKVARYFVVLGEKHGDDEGNHVETTILGT